jgi:hypothetical protein
LLVVSSGTPPTVSSVEYQQAYVALWIAHYCIGTFPLLGVCWRAFCS